MLASPMAQVMIHDLRALEFGNPNTDSEQRTEENMKMPSGCASLEFKRHEHL
jgi:hypothetical protein